MLEITEFDGRVAVRGETYMYKDIIKALPGHKWDPEHKAWTFPRTSHSFRLLKTLFPHAAVRSTLVDLDRNMFLLDEAMRCKKASDRSLQGYETKTEPWLHQKQAHHFARCRLLAQGGAMLALDMGTGKSKVAIDLVNDKMLDVETVLISCPTSVMDVWPDEFRIHSSRPAEVHVCSRKHNVERRMKEAKHFLEESEAPVRVVVINHEALWMKPFGEWAMHEGFDMLIVDECHRAKTPSGKLSRWLGRFPKHNPDGYRLGLTGTPCPHSIDDMYAQGRFIDPSVFGESHTIYKGQYMIQRPGPTGPYQIVVGYKNMDEWNERFHSMAIQVKADDVLDLPEAVHTNRYCDLDDERPVYDEMKSAFVAEVKSGVVTAANALVKLLRLAQITQGSVKDSMGRDVEVGTAKRDLLVDVLGDIDPSEPVVVFCRFKCDLRNIEAACMKVDRPVYELSGERNNLFEWKTACYDVETQKREGAVLAVQLQAGGVGISMVQAKYCIYMSKDFSLGNYEQSLARVHRPGQNRNVTYIHLVAKDTIDETITNALRQRKDFIEEVLDEMKGVK